MAVKESPSASIAADRTRCITAFILLHLDFRVSENPLSAKMTPVARQAAGNLEIHFSGLFP